MDILSENDRDNSLLIRLPESRIASWRFIKNNCPRIAANMIKEYNRVNGCIPYEFGYIYLLHATGSNFFKIGKSNNPSRRHLEIAPKMPFETKFVKIWKTQFMSLAEKRLHEEYSDYRVNGEWFDFSNPEVLRNLILSCGAINAAYAEEWCDRVFDWSNPIMKEDLQTLRQLEARKKPDCFALRSFDLLDAGMMADVELSGISIGLIQSFYDAIYADSEFPIPSDIQKIIAGVEPITIESTSPFYGLGGDDAGF